MTHRTRQQTRALHAYERVMRVPPGERADYATHVHALGSAVLRNGLAAALAFLERELESEKTKRDKPVGRLLEDLSDALFPGPPRIAGAQLPDAVRRLEMSDYMLATRELLQTLVWFRRAVQATFTQEERSHVAEGGR
ncbi:type III-B CRISPR module-associated protein Cmr5 [Archangium violaceum]|uniref:type III-B CRISPR module-associated protein Cmr5 n=1 Tax=Archangium violaceum TaxID=83451 RepID=UPI002B280891|nr:type III-B CRISPR module-associated protein Cmr5 [Archangium gephyra]